MFVAYQFIQKEKLEKVQVNKKFERSYLGIVFVINDVILLGRYIGSRQRNN